MEIEAPLQEQELIKRLQDGDEQAYKSLFSGYSDMVYRLCWRLLEDAREAEDATQDVFCKVFTEVRKFRAEAKLSSWLYRMTLNHCLNRRRQKRRAQFFSLDWLAGGKEEASSLSEDPAALVERKERDEILRTAIEALSETQRTALILCRFEGLSYQEIAEILQCSVAAVESRIFQAKKNLCKKLIPLLKDTSF